VSDKFVIDGANVILLRDNLEVSIAAAGVRVHAGSDHGLVIGYV
jgi:hypothetical protein